jgi:hypothetical protein
MHTLALLWFELQVARQSLGETFAEAQPVLKQGLLARAMTSGLARVETAAKRLLLGVSSGPAFPRNPFANSR